jgi:tetratricopeptide (TPR) repeat protein
MATSYNSRNMTLEALLDYFFERLPAEQEAAMEDFFDQQQDYADLIEEIGAYCLDHHIGSPEDYFEHFKDKEQDYLERYHLSGIKERPAKAGDDQASASAQTGKRDFGKNGLAILILLLALMAVLWFFVFPGSSSSGQVPASSPGGAVYAQEIYAEDFFNISMQLMGDNTSAADSTAYFLERIERQDSITTRAAIAYFGQIPDTAAAYPLSRYYLGHAYFVLGEYQDAARSFAEATLLLSEETREKDRADFLTALSYLAADDEAQAMPRLSSIANNENHAANAAATSVLKRVNSQ